MFTSPGDTTGNSCYRKTKVEFDCPHCGAAADASPPRDGGLKWDVGSFSLSCPGGGECLRGIARACGCTPAQLLGDAPRYLATLDSARPRTLPGKNLPPLPAWEWFRSCAVRLRCDPALSRYLRRDRGVSAAVLRGAGVGWDEREKRYVFPFFSEDGDVIAYKTRLPKPGAQMVNCAGKQRPWPLYPNVPRDDGWALLVAGELDALRGRSVGLPAVSVPLGAGVKMRPEWLTALVGLRRVVVCFDNNEEDFADARVRELVAAGIDAGRLSLRMQGLRTPKGDLSDLLRGPWDRERFVRRALVTS